MPINPYGEGSPYAGGGSFLDVLDIKPHDDGSQDLASLIGGEAAPSKGLTGVLQRALDKNPNLIKNMVGGFDMMNRSDVGEYSSYMLRNAKSYYNNLSDKEQEKLGDFNTWMRTDTFGRSLLDGRVSWDDATGLNWMNDAGTNVSWGGTDWSADEVMKFRNVFDPSLSMAYNKDKKDWLWNDPAGYKKGMSGKYSPYRFKREYGREGKGKGLFKYLSEKKPLQSMYQDFQSRRAEKKEARVQAVNEAKTARMEAFTAKYGMSNPSKEQIEDWLPKMKEELKDWTKKLYEFMRKGNLSTEDQMFMNNLKMMIKKEGARYEEWQKGLEDGIYPTMDEFERAEAQKVKDANVKKIKDKHAAFLAEQQKMAYEGKEKRESHQKKVEERRLESMKINEQKRIDKKAARLKSKNDKAYASPSSPGGNRWSGVGQAYVNSVLDSLSSAGGLGPNHGLTQGMIDYWKEQGYIDDRYHHLLKSNLEENKEPAGSNTNSPIQTLINQRTST